MGRKQAQAKKQPKPALEEANPTTDEVTAPSIGATAAAVALDIFGECASAISVWFFLIALTTKHPEPAMQGLMIRSLSWSSGKVRERIDATGLPDRVSITVRVVLFVGVLLTTFGIY